ncbi:hypothetical protein [Allorhizocola rhizosphaerae]|uniref:hypothetical protein n=1 Tax=Allorhizocola rhizosphaerae TaxID=1872709 RepID=UPI0013C35CFC|nr:hypothetical protein [Allorhizocola rhizosphaerae]
MRKTWIATTSLGVIAVVALAMPAVRGLAIETHIEEQSKECATAAGRLTKSATELQNGLAAVPPTLGDLAKTTNGLLGQVAGLIETGCLPEPKLPDGTPAEHEKQPPLPPLPSFPPLPSGFPFPSGFPMPTAPAFPSMAAATFPPAGGALTVPVCTDLTADLLDSVTGVLAALLSPDQPDVTAASSAVTRLLEALTKLSDVANNCLPSASAKR